MSRSLVKRYVSLLMSVVLCGALLPAAHAQDEFDVLRARWVELLTGGDYTDAGEVYQEYILPKVISIGSAGAKWKNSMVSDFVSAGYIWSDLQMGETTNEYKRLARPMSQTFERIEEMALAYKTKGSPLEGDSALRTDIIRALEYMYRYKYNENTPRTNRNLSPSNPGENWYEWEIRAPEAIVNTLALMYEELDKSLIDNLLAGIDKQVPSIGAAATGANRLDNCLMEIVGGIAQKNASRMKIGIDAVNTELIYSTSDDGFYADGSFIQHHQYPYNGGYGLSALGSIANIIYLISDSSFMPSNPDYRNIYDWVENSFDSLSYEGRMMDSVRGRSIARASDTGYGLLESVVLLSGFAPDSYSGYYKSIAKRICENNKIISPYGSMSSIYSVERLYGILTDNAVTSSEDKVFYKNFGAMDRAVAFRSGWAANISMYSDRIRNYESINGENLQGWHTASGAFYLYNDDLTQFTDNFWCTVDRHRIPGTTVLKGSASANEAYGNAFAGGAEMDSFWGVNAMLYSENGITAKKAWFTLDDEIVCLGSGITSSGNTETIVENRKVNYFTQDLIIDGTKTDTASGWSGTFANVSWAYMRGNTKSTANTHSTEIGYYFPDGGKLSAKRELRSGSWREVGTGSTTIVSNRYMSLALEHGSTPFDEKYAYALLPGRSSAKVKAYAQNPEFEIMSNTDKFQLVHDNVSGVYGAVVWEDGEYEVNGVTIREPQIALVRENDSVINISVSDPTQKNSVLHMTVNTPIAGILKIDDGVSVYKADGKTEIVVNTANSLGKTFHISLSKTAFEGVPQAPDAPTVCALSPTAALVDWGRTENMQYHLVYSESIDGVYKSVTQSCDDGVIHRDLTPGKTYYYRLAQSNEIGMSEYSEAASVTIPEVPAVVTEAEIDDDFSECNIGPLAYQKQWTVTLGTNRDAVDVTNDKKLYFYAAAAADSTQIAAEAIKKFAPMSGMIVAQGDFEIPDDSWKNLIVLSSGDTVAVQLYANGGALWTYNGKTWNTKHVFNNSQIEHNKTHHITVIADTDSDLFSVYLDGRKLEYSVDEPLSFRNGVDSIDTFSCGMTETTGEFWADNIKVNRKTALLSAVTNGETVRAEYVNPSKETKNVFFAAASKTENGIIDTACIQKELAGQSITVFEEKLWSADSDRVECYLWERLTPLCGKALIK